MVLGETMVGPCTRHVPARRGRDGGLNDRTPSLRGFPGSPLPDSNRRPPPYHGGALPTELRGRTGLYSSFLADATRPEGL